jgi:hypothetical protein
MTKVRQLFDQAPTYGPERLKVLGRAFDLAWQSLAGNFGEAPTDIDSARAILASVILSLPVTEMDSAERIKTAALEVLAAGYRQYRLSAPGSRATLFHEPAFH